MAKATARPADVEALVSLLHGHEDWKHLAVQARGKFLVIVALDDPQDSQGQELIRLEPLSADQFGLAIMWHTDRWQRLPVSGTLGQLVRGLREDFAALLAAC